MRQICRTLAKWAVSHDGRRGDFESLESRVLLSAAVVDEFQQEPEATDQATIVPLDHVAPTTQTVATSAGISSIESGPQGEVATFGANRAIWVWSMADPIVMDDAERLEFFSFLAAPHGDPNAAINVAFMSMTEELIDQHPQRVKEFLADAHSRGVTVDYLTGDPTWALSMINPLTDESYNQPSFELLTKVLAFNSSTSNPLERFDGFQQDTEPYVLEDPLDWDVQADRDVIWAQYVETVDDWQLMVDAHNGQGQVNDDIKLGAAIPFWWDPGNSEPADHRTVQDIVDYVAILCYDTRNPTASCTNELNYADEKSYDQSVYVGFETQEVFWKEPGEGFLEDVYPQTTSYYYQSNQILESDTADVQSTFGENPAFVGVAYHYYESLNDTDRYGETAYRSLGLEQRNRAPASLIRGLGKNQIMSGPFELRYDAIELDGDPLAIQIAYSNNQGQSWSLLPSLDFHGNSMQVNDGLYVLDTSILSEGNEYLIRLEAVEDKPGQESLIGVDVSDHVFQYVATVDDDIPPSTQGVTLITEPSMPTPGHLITMSWTPFADSGNGEVAGYFYSGLSPADLASARFTTSLSGGVRIDLVGQREVAVWALDTAGNISSPVVQTIEVYSDIDRDHVPDIVDVDRDGDGIHNDLDIETADDPTRFPDDLVVGFWDFENSDLSSGLRNGISLVATNGSAAFEATNQSGNLGTSLRLPNNPSSPVTLSTSRGRSLTGTTEAMTIEMWIKPEAQEEIDYIPLFFKGDLDQGLVVLLKNDGNQLSVRSYDSSIDDFGQFVGLNARNDDLFDGAWHHVALTYNGLDQAIKLYVDKELVAHHQGGKIPIQFSQPNGLRLFNGGSTFDNLNQSNTYVSNSALLENNRPVGETGDWENNTRYVGWVDDVKITLAALPPEKLGEGLEAEIVDQRLFYNNSAFDDAANGLSDNDAIASDKIALMPGDIAMFDNYSSYSRGLNGLVIDSRNLNDFMAVEKADFDFFVSVDGSAETWELLTAEVTIIKQPGDGAGETDRFFLVWPDNVIQNKWLQVTMKVTERTGLEDAHVFYFGHALGDTGDHSLNGDAGANTIVDVFDVVGVRQNVLPIGDEAGIENAFDFNRDKRVDLFDLIIARDNGTDSSSSLKLILAPEANVGSTGGVASAPAVESSPQSAIDVFRFTTSTANELVPQNERFRRGYRAILASMWSRLRSVTDRETNTLSQQSAVDLLKTNGIERLPSGGGEGESIVDNNP